VDSQFFVFEQTCSHDLTQRPFESPLPHHLFCNLHRGYLSEAAILRENRQRDRASNGRRHTGHHQSSLSRGARPYNATTIPATKSSIAPHRIIASSPPFE
jgi:hypothetical protein